MADCEATVKEIRPTAIVRLIGALTAFAAAYNPIDLASAAMSAATREYLEAMDVVYGVVKRNVPHFRTKQAEREAHRVDRTVKPAKKLAVTVADGDEWERVLADKDWDLCQLIQSAVAGITRLENLIGGVNPFIGAYSAFFENRLELAVNGMEKALRAVYAAGCWDAFEPVKTAVSKTLTIAKKISDSMGGEVDKEVTEWMKLNATSAEKAA